MIGYASNTGTRRNLDALRRVGWRILLTPENPTRREGLRYAIDNGAWSVFQKGLPFSEAAFMRVLEPNVDGADFVVVPDIVAAGEASLRFSLSWLPRLTQVRTPLLAVQNGMGIAQVAAVLREHPRLGIFLGGDTEWKLATMAAWGDLTSALGRYYHIGRVNSRRRIRLADEAGADSFDGTSATRYCKSLPRLEAARQRRSLFRDPLK